MFGRRMDDGCITPAVYALELAGLLDELDALTPEWKSCVYHVANCRRLAIFDVMWEAHKGTAEITLAASDAAIREFPTYYSLFFRAKALQELLRQTEAAQDYEISLKFCGEETRYCDAAYQLSKLKQETTSAEIENK